MLAAHVAISLVAIAVGFAMTSLMLSGRAAPQVHGAFLLTTILTSLSGFPLPAPTVLPSHIVAVISLVLLSLAVFARYSRRLVGRWRTVYAGAALTAFYFNLLVLVTQAFLHVPTLHVLAPKGNEPPFVAAQLLLVAVFTPVAFKAGRTAGAAE